MKITKISLFIALAFLFTIRSFGQEVEKLSIVDLPNLPAEQEGIESLGYAGMLGGVHNNVIIAAGGANFPNGLPWEGGEKTWSKRVYMLEGNQWRLSLKTLPIPLAYSASVSIEDGILSIGGENKAITSTQVLLLSYNPSTKDVEIAEYPDLPEPLAYTSAVVIDDYVNVVGGKNAKNSTNAFYRLNLIEKQTWEKLTNFPGLPRAVHCIAVQETSTNKKLFVIGGRNQVAGKKSEPLTNYLSYDLKEQVWQDEGDLLIDGKPRVLMGASAETMGSMHIMVYGGSDEVLFNELENLSAQLSNEQNEAIKKELERNRNDILNNHPGFSKDILAYNAITEKWFVYGWCNRFK